VLSHPSSWGWTPRRELEQEENAPALDGFQQVAQEEQRLPVEVVLAHEEDVEMAELLPQARDGHEGGLRPPDQALACGRAMVR
jgi:hypothetical protein